MTLELCAKCRVLVVELLDKRIQKILDVAHAEPEREDGELDDVGIAQAHCFHLVELKRIVEGQPTCGVFDDYGSEAWRLR